MAQLISLQLPNQKRRFYPVERLEEIALQLCGGGTTEKQTTEAMLLADHFRKHNWADRMVGRYRITLSLVER